MASGCPDRRQPVHVQDGGGGPSRRRRRPRRAGMLTVLVVLGALALAGAPASGPPSPHLRLASTADPRTAGQRHRHPGRPGPGRLVDRPRRGLHQPLRRLPRREPGRGDQRRVADDDGDAFRAGQRPHLLRHRQDGDDVHRHERGNHGEPPETGRSPATPSPPAAPGGVAAVGLDGEVDVSWVANGEPDVDAYRVLRDGADVSGPRGGGPDRVDRHDGGQRHHLRLHRPDPRHVGQLVAALLARRDRDPDGPDRARRPDRAHRRAGTSVPGSPGTPVRNPDLAGYRVLRDGGGRSPRSPGRRISTSA